MGSPSLCAPGLFRPTKQKYRSPARLPESQSWPSARCQLPAEYAMHVPPGAEGWTTLDVKSTTYKFSMQMQQHKV